MSNPVARQSAKYRRILRDLVSAGSFAVDGKRYGIMESPKIPDGCILEVNQPMKYTIRPKTEMEKEND